MEDDGSTLDSRGSADALQPSGKRLRLDSGSQEGGLWSYAGKSKPIGIAQPFPKRESVDSVDDTLELKAELRSCNDGLRRSSKLDDSLKKSVRSGGVETDPELSPGEDRKAILGDEGARLVVSTMAGRDRSGGGK
jgi:hypothetical protein